MAVGLRAEDAVSISGWGRSPECRHLCRQQRRREETSDRHSGTLLTSSPPHVLMSSPSSRPLRVSCCLPQDRTSLSSTVWCGASPPRVCLGGVGRGGRWGGGSLTTSHCCNIDFQNVVIISSKHSLQSGYHNLGLSRSSS